MCAAVLALVTLAAVRAEDAPADTTLRVWLEPKSMRAPVALPIVGAERTEMAFGRLGAEGLEPFGKGEVEPTDETFAAARANAAADLTTLKPAYTRNRQKVIEYAELRSTRPIVASAVLAPKFLSLFKSTLGDTVLVVVPNRYTAFVFPQLASRYQDYYPMVFDAFHDTAYPVSVEVFEFSVNGIRAIGVYQRP
jgi:hypothetical protein